MQVEEGAVRPGFEEAPNGLRSTEIDQLEPASESL